MILSDTSTNTIYLYAKRRFTTVLLPCFLLVAHYLLLDIFLCVLHWQYEILSSLFSFGNAYFLIMVK